MRLPDHLPASELILKGASPWQVAHGLLFLAESLARARKVTIAEALSHDGPLHTWVHLHDLKLAKPKRWERLILADVLDLERKLGGLSR